LKSQTQKAVAGALADLLVQADGRPREQKADEAKQIVFVRKIVYSGEPDDAA
jgi:hypothetical protein